MNLSVTISYIDKNWIKPCIKDGYIGDINLDGYIIYESDNITTIYDDGNILEYNSYGVAYRKRVRGEKSQLTVYDLERHSFVEYDFQNIVYKGLFSKEVADNVKIHTKK